MIEIKGRKGKIYVTLNEDYDFKELMIELNKNLLVLAQRVDQQGLEAVFDFKEKKLSNEELSQFFDVLIDIEKIYVVSFNNFPTKTKYDNEVFNGILRSGEKHTCKENLIFIGKTNPGSCINVENNLYLLGLLRGSINITNKLGQIFASYVEDASIEIFGVKYQVCGTLSNVKFYYNEGNIKFEEIINKRSDILWQEQL